MSARFQSKVWIVPRRSMQASARTVPAWLTILLAVSCGLIVANLYYAQPLVGPISSALKLSAAAAGLIVAMTQMGYCLGLLFIVPLGDLIENRRLILSLIIICMFATAVTASAHSAILFLLAALLTGLGASAVQVLVPYAAHLAPEESKGHVVGNVMSGLMFGIMLARPIASLVTHLFSWRTIFLLSAALMTLLTVILFRWLPERVPEANTHYDALLRSMIPLLRNTPILRRRAFYHFCLFSAFSLFWTTVPLYLAGPAYHLSQAGISLFAFVGIAGAISAPIAGRLADRGWTKPVTGCAITIVALAFVIMRATPGGSLASLLVLMAAGVLLDFGVTANLVLGQRAIFMLNAEYRGRLNGLYMAIFFVGGAIGSALGAWAYSAVGWDRVLMIGLLWPLVAFLYYSTDRS